ncbi:unnamed protein product [Phyllotreta striolata]|uniref:ABC transporter domain-containing protein n=1 Tax=Phyllotreta striolata TaxID=444603 RepID=A0A9N9TUF1_PHYSR|nr:unnamed protein product [Phyllotreta striolata]
MFHQLEVVIWKNLIIRKRHWFLTIIEAALPISLFLFIAYGRSKINGLNKLEITDPTYNDIHGIHYNINVGSTYFLYTPSNDHFDGIVNRLKDKLQLPGDQVVAFPNSEELLKYYYKNLNYTTIAVIFDDTNLSKFNYKIRYHDDSSVLYTSRKYVNPYLFQPRTGSAYDNGDFIPIQMALDMSFIEQNLKKDLDLPIMQLEFPYPPHKRDSFTTTLFLDLLSLITLFSFIFMCPAVLKRVVEEKYTGTKELMKMVGMESWMLWLGWFVHGLIPIIVAVVWIVIFMKVPMFGTDYPLIEFTNWGILLCFLILYCSAALTFCFAVSSFFSKPVIALVAGMLLWILSYFIPRYAFDLDNGNTLSLSFNIFLNILPNMALHYGYSAVKVFEEREIGVQWNNFYQSGSGGSDDVTMLHVYLMLMFDICFYMLFTLYMDGVNPGKYGVRKSILFPFIELRKSFQEFSNKKQVSNETVRLENVEDGNGLQKGIEICHLHKRYGHKMAVENLDLDIYKNQITVLLGHNGAGKSTTMSMITGMIEATSGSIKINGLSVKYHMKKIRQSLGLCPQHNLLFTDLTVKEHLLLFAKLKGKTSSEANKEANELLNKLNLSDKHNSLAHTLSGGMQRKLCLGMALIGGSKVLILDEPSSGMDPESRRYLWDLLLQWRGEKTILITTHFMEEADALGDWIAIMDSGRLECFGTPLDLKKKYETGYHLSLMLEHTTSEKEIAELDGLIRSKVPDAKMKSSQGNNVVFVLPIEKAKEFAALLEHLEQRKEELQINNVSVTITTLEDVFLKARAESLDDVDGRSELPEAQRETSGLIKYRSLFWKKLYFFKAKFKSYALLYLIALVFFILTIFLSNSRDTITQSEPELKLSLSTYKQTSVYYNYSIGDDFAKSAVRFYKKNVESEKSLPFNVTDVEKAIIKKSTENIAYYKEHMIAGASFQPDGSVIALYNALSIHSLPISLNLITDSLAKALLGPEYSISLSNWPLPTVVKAPRNDEFAEAKVGVLWLVLLPIGCLFVVSGFIAFPQIEISTKFNKLQYMCGTKPWQYWLTTFLCDFAYYTVALFVLSMLLWLLSPRLMHRPVELVSKKRREQKVQTILFSLNSPTLLIELNYSNCQGVLLLIFTMYGLSSIPLAYLFSRKKSASGALAAFVIMGQFSGVILTLIVNILLEFPDDYYKRIGDALSYLFYLFIPQVGLADSLVRFSRRAVGIYNIENAPHKLAASCMSEYMERHPCCVADSKECKDFKNYSGVLGDYRLVYMSALSFVLYATVNIMLDSYVVKKHVLRTISTVRSMFAKHQNRLLKVERIQGATDTLQASNLCKNYAGEAIVDNINLSLKDEQCLGILGVNGAGKSTTFRILTRDEVHDEGTIKMKIGEKTFDIEDSAYLETLGYCPQVDSLNFVLTGRQILSIIAQLRGEADPAVVDAFLKMFELEQYADVPCGHYSGGNKRKLSLAVSLIGLRKIVLLDEPTNGVDPRSRRKCWEFIKQMQVQKHLAFILTSHSMTECEALCNDLKIMKKGKFVKEGNLADLKNSHEGFSLKFKLCSNSNEDVDEVDGNCHGSATNRFNNIEELIAHFTKDNRGEIKDRHSGLLHFYIKEKNKKWSKIFKEVEEIKANNPHLIEDYAISEASLEDIFLQVARTDEEGPTNSKKNL